jgi:hypothetical protein
VKERERETKKESVGPDTNRVWAKDLEDAAQCADTDEEKETETETESHEGP